MEKINEVLEHQKQKLERKQRVLKGLYEQELTLNVLHEIKIQEAQITLLNGFIADLEYIKE